MNTRRAAPKPAGPDPKSLSALFEAILGLPDAAACGRFFEDLCTPGELSAMADRWKAAQLLDRGVPYREIYERTGVSTATVTRVARALFNGRGGYRGALDQAKAKRKT
ncbi:MAG: trp operon repressor [Proteobacteria bacterium]|nr:trp operon repressor [Pseudomonadota bacterium]